MAFADDGMLRGEPGSKDRVAKPGREGTPTVPVYRAQPNVSTKQPRGRVMMLLSRVRIPARDSASGSVIAKLPGGTVAGPV